MKKSRIIPFLLLTLFVSIIGCVFIATLNAIFGPVLVFCGAVVITTVASVTVFIKQIKSGS